MNIKGMGTQGVTNLYNKNFIKKVNSEKNINNEDKIKDKDRVEISALGKSLCAYDDINVDNRQKVQELKEKISNGTYNISGKLTAESIIKNFQKK